MTRTNNKDLPAITLGEMTDNMTIARVLLQEQPSISFENYWKTLVEIKGFTDTQTGGEPQEECDNRPYEPRGYYEAVNQQDICDLHFNKQKEI